MKMENLVKFGFVQNGPNWLRLSQVEKMKHTVLYCTMLYCTERCFLLLLSIILDLLHCTVYRGVVLLGQ